MVGATGLEHTAESPAKQALSETGGAISGAVSPNFCPVDPEVADLARRLAALPETVRAELVAMLKTGGVQK